MILLQTSHAENVTSRPNCDQYNESIDWANWPDPDCLELPRCLNLSSTYETCMNCGGKIVGHNNLIMICIPSYYKETLSHPPFNRVPMKDGKLNEPLNDIYITMRDVQVINIGMNTISIGMNFEASWFDYRLKDWNYPPKEYWTWTFLNMEFRNLIWFPDIITNNMVSTKKIDKKIILLRLGNNIPLIASKFYLITTVNCEMDFEAYPFDKHDCNLEVSYI